MFNANITAACTIYCEGPVLNAIQLAGIFNDSKTFVDMPMRFDPNTTLEAFNRLTNPTSKTVLEKYLEDYFLPAETDLNAWVPSDFTSSPPFLESITDAEYKQWGSDLNDLWLVLGREVNASVHEHPERHSYLPRNYPMVVPGGRFRESYYWDSWWIVRGLLVCDMSTTAKYVISNLLDDVNTFGFVPNGGRIYYLDRSQPPLLSQMLRTYYSYMLAHGGATSDLQSFMTSSYQSITAEYQFWMNSTSGQVVELSGAASGPVKLNRYYSKNTTPRPESYLVDVENAALSGRDPADYYLQVRAGAESGWDFSSRWIREGSNGQYNLTNIHTNEVVPADLNSIMYKFELDLAYFAMVLSEWASAGGDSARAETLTAAAEVYTAAASTRYAAINAYLWDTQSKHWRDYNLTAQHWTHYSASDAAQFAAQQALHAHDTAPSSSATTATATAPYATIAYWVPLWAGITPTDGTTHDQLVASLQASGLVQVAGVLTTNMNTGEQWDSPASWAPEVMFTIEGLQNLNTENSLSLAAQISAQWLTTCLTAFQATKYMYEKYNAFEIGVGGGGGEYVPQIGFGWSNGVALILLQQKYANSGSSGSDGGLTGPEEIVVVVSCVFAFLAVASMVFLHFYAPKVATSTVSLMSNGKTVPAHSIEV